MLPAKQDRKNQMLDANQQNILEPQSKTRSRSSDFLVFVALPLLLTALAMMLGAGWLLNGIARSVNAQEDTRTWQAVQAGVGALEDRLAGIASDNAHWDDAVKQTYGELNAQWAFDNWGVGSADVNYDTMYLLGGDGQVLAAFQKGKKLATAPSDYLGASLAGLLTFSHDSRGQFATLSTLSETRDGIAVVTAAPILPTSEDIPVDSANPNLAVFISHLSPALLRRLGAEFIVDDLQITSIGAAPDRNHVLNDHWGRPVAAATWTPRNPGEIASASYRNSVIGMVLGLLGVLIPLTLLYFRRLSELEAAERLTSHMARHDQLTGLINRGAFIAEADQLLRASAGDQVALALVDATNLNDINDTEGLAAGDEVVKTLTARLPAAGAGALGFARIGAGTFAIAFKGIDAEERAVAIAQAAIASLRKAVAIGEEQFTVPISGGVATAASGRSDASELIRRAEFALSYAQQSGPNQWRLYDRSLDLSLSDERPRGSVGRFNVGRR